MLPVFLGITVFLAMCSLAFSAARICVDPGHGGSATGTLGADGEGYPEEKDINLQIAQKLEPLLENFFGYCGENVFFTRNDDSYVSSQKRVDIANGKEEDAYGSDVPEGGVDYFVSIHCNAESGGGSSVHGTAVFIYDAAGWNDNPDQSTERYKLAEKIIAQYIERTDDIYLDACTYGGEGPPGPCGPASGWAGAEGPCPTATSCGDHCRGGVHPGRA